MAKKELTAKQWDGMHTDEATLKEIKAAVESTYEAYSTIENAKADIKDILRTFMSVLVSLERFLTSSLRQITKVMDTSKFSRIVILRKHMNRCRRWISNGVF